MGGDRHIGAEIVRSERRMWSCVLLDRSEPVAVTGRGDTDLAVEYATHGLGGSEAEAPGDCLHRFLAVGQRPAGGLDPDPFDVPGRGDTELRARPVISGWKADYNHRRRHSALGYQAPAVYAEAWNRSVV